MSVATDQLHDLDRLIEDVAMQAFREAPMDFNGGVRQHSFQVRLREVIRDRIDDLERVLSG